jgi:hypothetical protein
MKSKNTQKILMHDDKHMYFVLFSIFKHFRPESCDVWWQGKNAPLFSRTLANSNWLKPRKVDLKIREYRKKYSLLKYF